MNNDNESFAKTAKFKTSGTGSFTFFNINAEKQIRIHKPELPNARYKTWHVTLHTISKDNITYGRYEKNELAHSLKEAKLIAAGIYFKEISK